MNLPSTRGADFITDIPAKYLCSSHDALMSKVSQLARTHFTQILYAKQADMIYAF